MTAQGYLNNLTLPKSSAVANTSLAVVLSTELISEPSEHGGHIPYTGQPMIHVHESQCSSLFAEAPLVFYFPLVV